MKKKIILIGSSGMLGHVLSKLLKLKKKNVIEILRKKKSIKSKNIYYFKNFENPKLFELIKDLNPTHVINCAGVINHRITKKNLNEVFYINSIFPATLSLMANKLNYRFIHISTDCVFDGKRGNYTEKDKTNGSDYYARSKILGEYITNKSTVIRTSIIGHELSRKLGLLEWLLSSKNKVKGFQNVFFSGLTTLELSKVIYNYFIMKNLFKGKIVHVGGKKINKYNLIKLIVKLYKKELIIHSHNSKKIDKSLNSTYFRRNSGYKKKNWSQLILEMKKFNDKYFKK